MTIRSMRSFAVGALLCAFIFTFLTCDASAATRSLELTPPPKIGTSLLLKNPDLPKREGVKVPIGDYGNMFMHGAFRTSESFDTNVFLTDQKEMFDSITELAPSVGIDLPIHDHLLSADYEMKANLFATNTDQNYIDHRLRGLADIRLGGYSITARELYSRFSDRSGSEDTGRIHRETNELRAGIASRPDQFFDKLAFDLSYTNTIEHFLNDDLIYANMMYSDKNRMIHDFTTLGSYRIAPKTHLLLENSFGFFVYDHSSLVSNSWYLQPRVGLKGKVTSKIDSTLKIGFRYQNYDDTGSVVDGKNFIGPVASGGLTYAATERDQIALDVERAIYESVYANINYYTVNDFRLMYTHKFNDKLQASIYGSYQINLYPSETTENGVTAKRYDNFYTGGGSIRYDINKWASAQFKYEHTERHSRFSGFDYRDNLVVLQGAIGF